MTARTELISTPIEILGIVDMDATDVGPGAGSSSGCCVALTRIVILSEAMTTLKGTKIHQIR